MNINDFKIYNYFYTATGKWLCVDKGTYFVLAVKEENVENYEQGLESDSILIFDKFDFGGCRLIPWED